MYEPHHGTEAGGGFIMGLLCGAALGAAVGLMFAPKAGAELRQTLYDSTSDLRKKAYDAYDEAARSTNELISKGKDGLARGQQAYSTAREAAAD